MKKLLIALLATVAVAGVANVDAACGCEPKREPKVCPAKKTCPKRVSKCKRCPRVSKCERCPRVSKCSTCGDNAAMQDEMEAGVNDDLDGLLGGVVDTTDAAVTGAVNTTDDVVGTTLGSDTREQRRQERAQRREERRKAREERRKARKGRQRKGNTREEQRASNRQLREQRRAASKNNDPRAYRGGFGGQNMGGARGF